MFYTDWLKQFGLLTLKGSFAYFITSRPVVGALVLESSVYLIPLSCHFVIMSSLKYMKHLMPSIVHQHGVLPRLNQYIIRDEQSDNAAYSVREFWLNRTNYFPSNDFR